MRCAREYANVHLGRETIAALRATQPAARGMRRRDDGSGCRKPVELDARGQRLFAALRTLRRSIEGALSLPAQLVFADASQDDISRQRPQTPAAMARVLGVGPKKLAACGERLFEAIRDANGR